MVNVTKSNFIEFSNDLIANLPAATFIAIDEEMSGINLPGSGRPRKDKSPAERYEEIKGVPQRYSIIQLGISLFTPITEEEDEDGEIRIRVDDDEDQKQWRVRRYNFYTFPDKDSPRDVVISPSAAAFLTRHNMSYEQWVKEGVTHVFMEDTLAILEKYKAERMRKDEEAQETPKSPTVHDTIRRVELRRQEDIQFFSRCMANLREWLDNPVPRRDQLASEGTSFLLPACSSFMRRAFYESIKREYPALVLENAGPESPDQIRVWRLNEEEKLRREARLRREDWENTLVNKVGLTRVFAALSSACNGLQVDRRSVLFAPSIDHVDWNIRPTATLERSPGRKIPLVVHNGFMDIGFMMTHFVSDSLPSSLNECKHMIRDFFPLIYDTKVLATEHSIRHSNGKTNLGELFEKIGTTGGLVNQMENVVLSPTAPPDQEHEAAYDAYMTGVCFIGLCNEIRETYGLDGLKAETHDENSFRTCMGRNRLYQLSMYTMDLESLNGDPMSRGMSPEATYRVSGIDPAITTRDIVRCLSNLTDDTNRTIQFEIIWVDDTTFLAGANFRDGLLGMGTSETEQEAGLGVVREHGKVVERALIRRFSKDSVVPLAEYLEGLKEGLQEENKARPSMFTRLAQALGFGKRIREDGHDGNDHQSTRPTSKRRRLR